MKILLILPVSWENSKPFWRYQNISSREEDVHLHSPPNYGRSVSEERQLINGWEYSRWEFSGGNFPRGVWWVGIFPYGTFTRIHFPVYSTNLFRIANSQISSELFLNNLELNNLINHAVIYSHCFIYPVETGRKLNVHKTSRTSSERFMCVQFTSCLYGVTSLRGVINSSRVIDFLQTSHL